MFFASRFVEKHKAMIQKLLLSVITLFLTTGAVFGQQETLFGGSNSGITGIWVSLNRNYSEFKDDDGTAGGYTVGLEIGQQFVLGYARESIRERPLIGSGEDPFDFTYRGGLVSYAPLVNKVVHPRFSLIGGIGNADLGEADLDRILVLRPAVGVEVNVAKWFRLGLEGGYRHVEYDELAGYGSGDFSSWFLELGLRFGISWED